MDKAVPDGFKRIKFDKKEASRKLCVYCLHKADTRDHLPPRNLFPVGVQPIDMRTVPSCEACNQHFANGDDDHFRNIIVAYCASGSPIAQEMLSAKVARSIARNPSIAKKISTREEWVNVTTPSGIIVGRKKEKMPFTREEEAGITRMLHRLCKGYAWDIYKRPAPLNSRVKLLTVNETPPEFINALKASELVSTGNPDVFMWKALPVTLDELLCFFWFTFYNKFSMIVLFYADKRGNVFGRVPSSSLFLPQ